MEHMKDIEIGRSHFGGQPVAKCKQCGWTCVYWEDPQDLEHECLTEEEETAGACDFCDYYNDPADIAPIRYRYTVGPRRTTRVEGNACSACHEFISQCDDIEIMEGATA